MQAYRKASVPSDQVQIIYKMQTPCGLWLLALSLSLVCPVLGQGTDNTHPVITVTFPSDMSTSQLYASLVGVTNASTTLALGCAPGETAPATPASGDCTFTSPEFITTAASELEIAGTVTGENGTLRTTDAAAAKCTFYPPVATSTVSASMSTAISDTSSNSNHDAFCTVYSTTVTERLEHGKPVLTTMVAEIMEIYVDRSEWDIRAVTITAGNTWELSSSTTSASVAQASQTAGNGAKATAIALVPGAIAAGVLGLVAIL